MTSIGATRTTVGASRTTVGGAGGTPPWSPADVTTKAWLDTSDAGTVTAAAGRLTMLADKSGNGVDFECRAGGAYEPHHGATTQNGLDTVGFDGGNFLIDYDTPGHWSFLHDGTPFVIGIACKQTSTGSGLIGNTDGGNSCGLYLYKHTDSALYNVVNASSGVRPVENFSAAGYLGTGWEATVVIGEPDHATPASRSSVQSTGQAPFANNSSSAAVNPAAASQLMAVMSLINDGGSIVAWSTGEFGELVMLSGADATPENAALLATYLARWT